ncbi:hypothetical protein [Rhizorhabdus wittichii]|uniref:hypothetical protein n=1 Tax=Rhizorhabdus wittichii TaxID=160791 RepID=UPI0003092735|nr:hypothetical protein [Rhizorhabdus wittichii]
MAKFSGTVLLDNNAIGDAVDLGVWKGLIGAYSGQLETVAEVADEAGTYFRRKDDAQALMASLKNLQTHEVSNADRARLLVEIEGLSLDAGERDLWSHAIGRSDNWILCGPDRASLRAAVRLGLQDRLVSLEQLLESAGLPTRKLPREHTSAWLRAVVGEMVVEERLK